MLICLVTLPAYSGERPNFIIILTDDLGYGDIGLYGSETLHNPPIFTPRIDELINGGLRFNDFHSSNMTQGEGRCPTLWAIDRLQTLDFKGLVGFHQEFVYVVSILAILSVTENRIR